jgi:hypothetical protein
MFLKRKMIVLSTVILSTALVLPMASAASTASPSPFTVVAKLAGFSQAQAGCISVGSSLALNNAFLKMPAAQQTETKKTQTIAAENAYMLKALQAFKAAAKANKKWKQLATDINTFLNANDADTFTKAFGGLLNACTAINPAKK